MAQGAKTVFVSIGTTPIFQERRPTSKALRSALYAKAPVVIADAEGRGVFSWRPRDFARAVAQPFGR